MTEYYRQAWDELLLPGADFAMEEIEVRGSSMFVYEQGPRTMREVWETAALNGDRTYLVYEDESFTYSEVDSQVRALAAHLRESHGVSSGDRVAVAMRNYPEWVISYWAIVSIGASVVGMNAWWTGPEMEYGLVDSSPKVLIADEERVGRIIPHLEGLRESGPLHVLAVRVPDNEALPGHCDRWEEVIDPASAPTHLPPADIDPDDDATIFYTSGTTGSPKGAQLTHRGVVHNILNVAFMATVGREAAAKRAIANGEVPAAVPDLVSGPQKVFMASTPLFHVTACNCVMQPATFAGAKVVLMYKWDPARALELIERESVTNFSGVPTMSRELVLHEDWPKRKTSSLETLGGGGAPLPPDLVVKIDDALPVGVPTTGYGLTETCGIVSGISAGRFVDKPASCGPVVPTLDYKLIDSLGNDLGAGDTGELCVKGPVVVKGYINRPEATAEAVQNGWFRTGDIVNFDEDGDMFLVDRAKDIVIRGGENVYCSEVEAAIYAFPGISEVAVFGIPDERMGEAVAAAIVLQPGVDLDEMTLQVFLATSLAKFKLPTTVWFRSTALPRNANGKFLKRDLRTELLA